MENKNLTNEEKHLEALKQKNIDSVQILDFLKFNMGLKSEKVEEELNKVLQNEELNLTESVRKEIIRCLQIAKGYTEYKVTEIAENTGFNRTRTKALIKHLIDSNAVKVITLETTTFITPMEAAYE